MRDYYLLKLKLFLSLNLKECLLRNFSKILDYVLRTTIPSCIHNNINQILIYRTIIPSLVPILSQSHLKSFQRRPQPFRVQSDPSCNYISSQFHRRTFLVRLGNTTTIKWWPSLWIGIHSKRGINHVGKTWNKPLETLRKIRGKPGKLAYFFSVPQNVWGSKGLTSAQGSLGLTGTYQSASKLTKNCRGLLRLKRTH